MPKVSHPTLTTALTRRWPNDATGWDDGRTPPDAPWCGPLVTAVEMRACRMMARPRCSDGLICFAIPARVFDDRFDRLHLTLALQALVHVTPEGRPISGGH